ncbi:helix-turn-helix domain-containing protein [Streptomyces tsukubensis]|uniref:DNA-binding protein n=1 Tax=Streptomyces tsukubensis TaxID=83656 RepID=A0A1V4A150_9ACTN|nr:helix-turn-helix transcriptional regulator [Streptomyces tsukubensis]OON72915.1 DNA-binding protein [Streptomyces tsukubensis]QFR94483.1 helix-turn-helix domain-containing protein [Streptomyces tsukubensis]
MAGDRADRGKTISTVLGRRLGGELLALRESRGLRQASSAEALTASVAKVAKMERGLVPMRDPDVRALCHLYEVQDPVVVNRLLALARADRDRRKAKGWWNQYPQMQAMVEYVALEDIATNIRTWQLAVIPGLLQTPDYARALAVGAGSWDDPDEIEPFVEARLARQERLRGERPLQLWAVLWEGALRQLVGGRSVMREQLGHLSNMARQPNVKLQILPCLAGAHPGMTSAFSIVSFDEQGALDVVFAESTSSTVWLESETDAVHHAQVFDRIARQALAQTNTVSLIDAIRKEF